MWSRTFRLSPRAGGTLFTAIGAVLFACAGVSAYRSVVRLRTWPAVDAHVDSATIVTPQRPREAVYAARYWVSYPRLGHTVKTVVTQGVFTSNYAGLARAVGLAHRSGSVRALINPTDAWALTLDTPWHGDLFFTALVLGFLALAFGGLGAAFLWASGRGDAGGANSFWIPLPARYGVVFCLVMGTLFLGTGTLAGVLSARQHRTWRRLDAGVDSADVVSSSDRNGTTYAPRYWLSYAVGDSLLHSPLVQSWSSSSYQAQARRAAEAARARRMSVLVNQNDPYDVKAGRESAWVSALWYGLWGFFTLLCFGLAYVFHRISGSDKRRSRRAAARRAAGGATA